MGYAQRQVSLSLQVNIESVMIHEAAVCIFNSQIFLRVKQTGHQADK